MLSGLSSSNSFSARSNTARRKSGFPIRPTLGVLARALAAKSFQLIENRLSSGSRLLLIALRSERFTSRRAVISASETAFGALGELRRLNQARAAGTDDCQPNMTAVRKAAKSEGRA